MKTRTIFEKWMKSRRKEAQPSPNLTKNKDGSYANETVDAMWIAFEAAARLME